MSSGLTAASASFAPVASARHPHDTGLLQLAYDAGERVMVTGPRQRILLATLAAHANQPVSF